MHIKNEQLHMKEQPKIYLAKKRFYRYDVTIVLNDVIKNINILKFNSLLKTRNTLYTPIIRRQIDYAIECTLNKYTHAIMKCVGGQKISQISLFQAHYDHKCPLVPYNGQPRWSFPLIHVRQIVWWYFQLPVMTGSTSGFSKTLKKLNFDMFFDQFEYAEFNKDI